MSNVGVAVAPEHLCSLRAICKRFKRGSTTVRGWRKGGAPIAFDGVSYSAEYNALQEWLVENCNNNAAIP